MRRPIVRSDEPEDLRDAFQIKKRGYTQQFAHLYFVRLTLLKKDTVRAAKAKWAEDRPDAIYTNKLLDMSGAGLRYGVGIVYIEMEDKPNIIDDITRENWVEAPPPKDKYCCGTNIISLEDESGRINLVGDILNRVCIVTGAIIAVLGKESDSGDFEVVDVCFPGMAPQIERPLAAPTPGHSAGLARYVAFVSGLMFGSSMPEAQPELTRKLADYLTASAKVDPGVPDPRGIVKLVVAGNSYIESPPPAGYTNDQRLNPRDTEQNDMVTLDHYFGHLVGGGDRSDAFGVPVDVMPGPLDPTLHSMPQPPLMKGILFPSAARSDRFRTLSNPAWIDVGGLRMLGTSGQPVKDISKYFEDGKLSELDILRHTLYWRHIAPTAPDTLGSYPFIDYDPFVLSQSPHVYFAGNQTKFDTATVKDNGGVVTRIICVPKFAETGELVLMDINTLECVLVNLRT
ncbi:DNA polymerase delta small subunit Cdc1 [Spiromyces aspiralis]|uniref:DNA polymerase delta small subunit Cdc1 n=1 Tax=Spiromyces aspiralis TaxID=68401 RepID=A0ACC1HT99_9FUNG|nr:DNA polymerase delta small subunit Cdc1 [Spiromyces aspiralis]